MTFPKYAKFGLTVCILALFYEIFRIISGPNNTINYIFIGLGILASIVGILYFSNELRKES